MCVCRAYIRHNLDWLVWIGDSECYSEALHSIGPILTSERLRRSKRTPESLDSSGLIAFAFDKSRLICEQRATGKIALTLTKKEYGSRWIHDEWSNEIAPGLAFGERAGLARSRRAILNIPIRLGERPRITEWWPALCGGGSEEETERRNAIVNLFKQNSHGESHLTIHWLLSSSEQRN